MFRITTFPTSSYTARDCACRVSDEQCAMHHSWHYLLCQKTLRKCFESESTSVISSDSSNATAELCQMAQLKSPSFFIVSSIHTDCALQWDFILGLFRLFKTLNLTKNLINEQYSEVMTTDLNNLCSKFPSQNPKEEKGF